MTRGDKALLVLTYESKITFKVNFLNIAVNLLQFGHCWCKYAPQITYEYLMLFAVIFI